MIDIAKVADLVSAYLRLNSCIIKERNGRGRGGVEEEEERKGKRKRRKEGEG